MGDKNADRTVTETTCSGIIQRFLLMTSSEKAETLLKKKLFGVRAFFTSILIFLWDRPMHLSAFTLLKGSKHFFNSSAD